MIKTSNHTTGVVGCTNLARGINPEIGKYLEHYQHLDNYRVKLSNGALTVPISAASDYERDPKLLTEERIASIAATFKKTKSSK